MAKTFSAPPPLFVGVKLRMPPPLPFCSPPLPVISDQSLSIHLSVRRQEGCLSPIPSIPSREGLPQAAPTVIDLPTSVRQVILLMQPGQWCPARRGVMDGAHLSQMDPPLSRTTCGRLSLTPPEVVTFDRPDAISWNFQKPATNQSKTSCEQTNYCMVSQRLRIDTT